ncbi:hypothetical protein Golomagni_08407, partial [Golovinomyces magnicellulatus]
LACHNLFASSKRHVPNAGFDKRWGGDTEEQEAPPLPFSGPRADYLANEAEKHNRAMLQAMQSDLSPSLMRSFRSAEDMATGFIPYLSRMLSPDVKPVVVGGSQGTTASVRKDSERRMVKRASDVLAELGIDLIKGQIESSSAANRNVEYVYRMEPDIDSLAMYETGVALLSSQAPTRYAVRQVLDQELRKSVAMREAEARQARFKAGGHEGDESTPAKDFKALLAEREKENADLVKKAESLIKRDFFGRVIVAKPLAEIDNNNGVRKVEREHRKVWVTYHEGLNNAVRKPITLQEFMKVFE